MNTKEFVSFLRVFLSDKKKLTKSQVEELKYLLEDVYNELPQDFYFQNLSNVIIKEQIPPTFIPKGVEKSHHISNVPDFVGTRIFSGKT